MRKEDDLEQLLAFLEKCVESFFGGDKNGVSPKV